MGFNGKDKNGLQNAVQLSPFTLNLAGHRGFASFLHVFWFCLFGDFVSLLVWCPIVGFFAWLVFVLGFSLMGLICVFSPLIKLPEHIWLNFLLLQWT